MSTVPPINRANAARALLEHNNRAPWWFDLWGRAVEYTAGGATQTAVEVTGDTVQLSPGAAIYRRDLTGESGAVSVNIRAGGLAIGRVLTFELHLETGAIIPAVTWDNAIQWEDFGWPHLEKNRTHVFYFRSTDGGKTWIGGLGYTYGPRKLYRGGLIQKAAAVTGATVSLAAETVIYRIDMTAASGEVSLGLDAASLDAITRCNTIIAELHIKAGASDLTIPAAQNVTFADFGGLWRIEKNRVTVAEARSYDGGATWTVCKLYTYRY